MAVRPVLLTLAVAALVAACGVESSRVPTAPPGSGRALPAPAPTRPDGIWPATFASSNWPHSPFPIVVELVLTGDRITGIWYETLWLDYGGRIDGVLDAGTFTGTVSVNDCSGPFRGPLAATEGMLTSPALSEDCGPIFGSVPNPVEIRLLLSR